MRLRLYTFLAFILFPSSEILAQETSQTEMVSQNLVVISPFREREASLMISKSIAYELSKTTDYSFALEGFTFDQTNVAIYLLNDWSEINLVPQVMDHPGYNLELNADRLRYFYSERENGQSLRLYFYNLQGAPIPTVQCLSEMVAFTMQTQLVGGSNSIPNNCN